MFNASITIRTFLAVAIAAVLAIVLGYIVASPLDKTSLAVYGLVLGTLAFPFLLRWHHPMLIAVWNMNAVVFFLPGRPPLWLFMVLISVLFSLGHFALDKRAKYNMVPQVVYPLVFLTVVILVTAKLTGGISIGSLGGQTSGGKRYILLLGAILGYFAMTCYRIPLQRAFTYVMAYFIGGATAAIGNLLPLINPAFYIIFAIFPPEQSGLEALGLIEQSAITRFGGLTLASTAIYCILLACYGIRGIFDLSGPLRFLPFSLHGGFSVNKPWRLIIFLLAITLSLFGGFRSVILIFALTFAIQFFFERLFSSVLFPIFIVIGILVSVIALPMADRLPLAIQRALSVLPIEVDPIARASAEDSSEWRLNMWKLLLPQVPQYLLLGKGYALKSQELEVLNNQATQAHTMETAIVAGDYHSGPLSVIIPLGIFGVIGFLWFLLGSIKVLFANYRYGEPALINVNRFLLVFFIARVIFFFAVFGSLYSEMVIFTGLIGLSVSLNGGMRNENSAEIEAKARKEIAA